MRWATLQKRSWELEKKPQTGVCDRGKRWRIEGLFKKHGARKLHYWDEEIVTCRPRKWGVKSHETKWGAKRAADGEEFLSFWGIVGMIEELGPTPRNNEGGEEGVLFPSNSNTQRDGGENFVASGSYQLQHIKIMARVRT